MSKPKVLIRYEVGGGYIECDGEALCVGVDPSDQYGGGWVKFGDKAEAATVLLSLGKALLDQIGDSAVSKEVLLETGLDKSAKTASAQY